MGFLTWLWNGVRGVVAFLLPFGESARGRRWGPGVRWALHGLVLVVILVLLHLLNRALEVERLIRGQSDLLRYNWLPILFLLVYALAWLAWWLWGLLTAEDAPQFPDIDAAWDEAVHALAQTHVTPADLPLFLVLGRPEGPDGLPPGERGRKSEEILFQQAGNLNLVVKQTPATADAPLHVYANHEGIFVTCAGASLLGQVVSALAGELTGPVQEGPSPDESIGATLGPNARQVKPVFDVVNRIQRHGAGGTEEDRRMLRRMSRPADVALLKDSGFVSVMAARLRHLCKLIVRDRRPYCPVNGILILVPLGATDTEAHTQAAADALALDLRTARAALKVDCPQFALVCDAETASGFRVFVGRQDAKDRHRRVGQRFPLGTDLQGQALAEALDGSVRWLCNNVMREWVYRLFRTEGGKDEQAAVLADNSRLFLLLDEMRSRDERLSRILTRGVAAEAVGPLRFGGCYLGATGPEPGQQAFVGGVFRRLVENQDVVAWTEPARAEDTSAHRTASLGYLVLGVFWLAVVGWMAWSLLGQRATGS